MPVDRLGDEGTERGAGQADEPDHADRWDRAHEPDLVTQGDRAHDDLADDDRADEVDLAQDDDRAGEVDPAAQGDRGDPPDQTAQPDHVDGPDQTAQPLVLPPQVRARVAALAADRLGALPPEQVPVALRPYARFTPAKRARLAAVPLAAALERDVVFRQRVADGLREALPELAQALVDGTPLPAVAPEDVAAAAYVLRPPSWRARVEQVCAQLQEQVSRPVDSAHGTGADTERLRALLRVQRDAHHEQLAALEGERDAARHEVVALRKRLRELGDRVGRAEAGQRAAMRALEDERAALARDREAAVRAEREARARAEAADRHAAHVRAAGRESRAADELRLRVLLDALVGAATGLRRELALPPAQGRPADALAPDYPAAAVPAPARGLDRDDPQVLDALLRVPMAHLMVDGYNVTKTGYGDLTLEAQRGRLLSGLGALAARTGAEVTVVFDGRDGVLPSALPAPRHVRLLFSREGETADEVLRRLAGHEPAGRPVVVVSSDREVADGVRARGATDLPATALLRLLARP